MIEVVIIVLVVIGYMMLADLRIFADRSCMIIHKIIMFSSLSTVMSGFLLIIFFSNN